MAFTAEPDRRRGAQQALIARRIEQATALGCRILVSETLSFLKSSLGNAVTFALLILVLLFRPNGLFARTSG